MKKSNTVITIIISMVVTFTMAIFIFNWWQRETIQNQRAVFTDFAQRIYEIGEERKEIVEEKKKEFLDTTAVSFIYVNEVAMNDFYNMTFKEPTIQSAVEKLIEKRTGEIQSGKAAAAVLETNLGKESISEYIRSIKLPETTLAEKYLRYQRFILENERVQCGFDEIDIKLEQLQKFDKAAKDLEEKFGILISNDFKETKKQEIKRKLVDELLKDLEKVEQQVLLSGKYLITTESDKNYKLTYEHPINKHLKPFTNIEVLISCLLDKSLIDDSYKSEFENMAIKGTKLPFKIFGKVLQPIDSETNNWELRIIPFAVY